MPIEEVNAFVAEFAAGMVVNHIQQDSEPMQMTEVDEGLEIITLEKNERDEVRARGFLRAESARQVPKERRQPGLEAFKKVRQKYLLYP